MKKIALFLALILVTLCCYSRSNVYAKKYDVEVPIIEKVNDILFNGSLVKDAVGELMNREKKEEYYGLMWQDD